MIFVTSNLDKFREAAAILRAVPLRRVALPDLIEVQGEPEEVVVHKALAARARLAGPLFVEDSALCLEALGGLPGSYTKAFEEKLGLTGIVRLTEPFANTRATALCAIAYSPGGEQVRVFVGRVEGCVVPPRGAGGFGWDAIFCPEGHNRTFAEMAAAEKDALSHRRLALDRLREHLVADRR